MLALIVTLLVLITTITALPHNATVLNQPTNGDLTNEPENVDYRQDPQIPVLLGRILSNHRSPVAIPGSNKHARGIQHYSLGSRIKGDSFIYGSQYDNEWEEPQNAIAEIRLPQGGISDAFISYVLIHVEESNGSQGQAYVLDGGIGKRFVELQIISRNTSILRYQVLVYGVKI